MHDNVSLLTDTKPDHYLPCFPFCYAVPGSMTNLFVQSRYCVHGMHDLHDMLNDSDFRMGLSLMSLAVTGRLSFVAEAP